MSEIYSMNATFIQPMDAGADTEEEHNTLEIEIIDHGDGPDVVLRTERWALAGKEDLQRFVDVLSDLIDKVQDKRISRNN
jgi:hypothetical protein